NMDGRMDPTCALVLGGLGNGRLHSRGSRRADQPTTAEVWGTSCAGTGRSPRGQRVASESATPAASRRSAVERRPGRAFGVGHDRLPTGGGPVGADDGALASTSREHVVLPVRDPHAVACVCVGVLAQYAHRPTVGR